MEKDQISHDGVYNNFTMGHALEDEKQGQNSKVYPLPLLVVSKLKLYVSNHYYLLIARTNKRSYMIPL